MWLSHFVHAGPYPDEADPPLKGAMRVVNAAAFVTAPSRTAPSSATLLWSAGAQAGAAAHNIAGKQGARVEALANAYMSEGMPSELAYAKAQLESMAAKAKKEKKSKVHAKDKKLKRKHKSSRRS
jgi:hypothetical protein